MEDLARYMKSLPEPGTPEFQDVLIDAGARAIAAIEAHIPENEHSRSLLIPDRGRLSEAEHCVLTREGYKSLQEDPTPQPYRYARLRDDELREEMRFIPGGVPEFWDTKTRRFVPVDHPLVIEQAIDQIAKGTPYSHSKQMIVGNRIVNRRSLRGMAERALNSLLNNE